VLIPLFSGISKRELPEVEQFHMVDESLIQNTIRAQKLTKTTIRRVLSMVESAREGGADAVVVTCSSIGPAASVARRLYDFPVIRVDEAMAEEAVRAGKRIGVAATLRTTLEPTVALLREKAVAAQCEVDLVESLCEGAFEAVLSGDTASHDRILTDSLNRLVRAVDVVVLAQASMARVVAQLPEDPARVPILSSPELAVKRARSMLFPETAVLH
jgi:Asp/Glu/hydantoin racemase